MVIAARICLAQAPYCDWLGPLGTDSSTRLLEGGSSHDASVGCQDWALSIRCDDYLRARLWDIAIQSAINDSDWGVGHRFALPVSFGGVNHEHPCRVFYCSVPEITISEPIRRAHLPGIGQVVFNRGQAFLRQRQQACVPLFKEYREHRSR